MISVFFFVAIAFLALALHIGLDAVRQDVKVHARRLRNELTGAQNSATLQFAEERTRVAKILVRQQQDENELARLRSELAGTQKTLDEVLPRLASAERASSAAPPQLGGLPQPATEIADLRTQVEGINHHLGKKIERIQQERDVDLRSMSQIISLVRSTIRAERRERSWGYRIRKLLGRIGRPSTTWDS
jgi:hypothetical protein